MARILAGLNIVVIMAALASGSATAYASGTPVLALVVKSPKPTYDWTVQSLEQALTPVGAWAARHNYEHTAKRLHLQTLMNPQAARRIGSELGLTHVLFVAIRNTVSGGQTKTFADIELLDTGSGSVLVKRSYFLPDHRISAGTASYIADFLALRLNVSKANDANINVASGGRDENFGEMHGRDIDDVPPPPPPPSMHGSGHAHPKKKSPVAFLQGLL